MSKSSLADLGFTGHPISKFECPKCKCTIEDPCTLSEIALYQNNGVKLIPEPQNLIMCDMDIFDINLEIEYNFPK